MSEQFSTHPGQVDPSSVDAELVARQQNTIRDLTEGRIGGVPMEPGPQAEMKAAGFGLDKTAYDVFIDKEAPFAGGFIKFVSKEDSADTLVGVSWSHIGGNVSNPNTYIYNYALKPNGDIIGILYAESSNERRPTIHEYKLAGNSSDPTAAKQYKQALSSMHDKAQEMVASHTAVLRDDATSGTESGPQIEQTRRNRLSKWLGRSSLR